MWDGDVEAKIDKAFRGVSIGRGCDAAGRKLRRMREDSLGGYGGARDECLI